MNEDSETIELDGSTAGGAVVVDYADLALAVGSGVDRARAFDVDSTLTPSATLVAQNSDSSMEDGVGESTSDVDAGDAVAGAAAGSMKNSKSVSHFLHCLLPGTREISSSDQMDDGDLRHTDRPTDRLIDRPSDHEFLVL